jgi:hypothetical protein
MLKRHEVQVLRRAGHTWKEIAALSGVSVRTVRRIAAEAAIAAIDNAAERARRQVGGPSKADAYRDVLVQALTAEPTLRSVELLHRARQDEIVHFFASRLKYSRWAAVTLVVDEQVESPQPLLAHYCACL